MLDSTCLSTNIEKSSKRMKTDCRSFRFISLLALSVQASNLVVIDNEDLVLVSDVLDFMRKCVINIDQPFMFESDVA